MSIDLYTIGFTKKNAAEFFGRLQTAGVKVVLDIRLKNNSQVSGFAKRDHLEYFLRQIGGIEYRHLPDLAPKKEILDAYKDKESEHKGDWSVYEKAFLELMQEREIEDRLDKEEMDKSCLLCSEHEPHYCHRRLVAEYLQEKWQGQVKMQVVHL